MSSKKMVPIVTKESDATNNGEDKVPVKITDRPTFILKTRDSESRSVSPSQRDGNKKESEVHLSFMSRSLDARSACSPCPELTKSIKLLDENLHLCEGPLEYLAEQTDFLVVGVIGGLGVGKSTIMSLLTNNHNPDIFPVEEISHIENASNCTVGIDFYVTKNRIIYLDTQPILAGSVVEHPFEQKRNTNDFFVNESNVEVQSLQFTAFLMSICHVVIFVQDWFVDSNMIRFIQTAEMLKPSSTTTVEQDYVEHYPHILFVHNKATMQDFMPANIEMMEDFYAKAFAHSRLQCLSGLNMSDSNIENQVNFFLIPQITKNKVHSLFNRGEISLIENLRSKIHGVVRNAMTPSILTERSWFHYIPKVLEAIRKGHLSSEYGRLMP